MWFNCFLRYYKKMWHKCATQRCLIAALTPVTKTYYLFTTTSHVRLHPAFRNVSATEQYLSIDNWQARLALSISISPFNSKTIFTSCHNEGSTPCCRPPSIFI